MTEAKRQGARFTIYLPVAEGEASPDAGAAPGRAARGTETVLLVEDDPAVRLLAEEALTRLGYVVLTAADGHQAVRLAEGRSGSIDLLLTDVVMPNGGGRQVAESLTATDPGLRVMYMSGYTDDEVLRHGVQQSQIPFIQKPFTAEDLARKVREVLDR